MGDLLTTIRVGGKAHPIKPVPRLLECGSSDLTLKQTCKRSGGLILGEGDTGKTTYAKMLVEEAKSNGPTVLIHLRQRRLDFPLPEPNEDEIATIVFDGLDEFPESARDIIDYAEPLNPDRYHIWVTSRACDAAALLAESFRFEIIHNLAAFTVQDVIKIADSVEIDGYEFFTEVHALGLDSFLEKPGGAVLLLQMYAQNRILGSSRIEIMEEIAKTFALESRDGHNSSEADDDYSTEQLIDAAGWISVCLEFTHNKAVWTGPEIDTPIDDLYLPNIIRGDKGATLAALGRRLFEPLGATEFRITYSEMPDYLAGLWIAKHIPVESFRTLLRRRDVTSFVTVFVWASCFNSEYGKSLIRQAPHEFFICRNLIEEIGFETFLDLIVPHVDLSYFQNPELYELEPDNVTLLRGYYEFALYLKGVVTDPKTDEPHLLAAAFLLTGCLAAHREVVSSIVTALQRPSLSAQTIVGLAGLLALNGDNKSVQAVQPLKRLYLATKKAKVNIHRTIAFWLSKYFDYPSWLIASKNVFGEKRRNTLLEECGTDKGESFDRSILTEREVAEMLEELPSADMLKRIVRIEDIRGLDYRSLVRFFDDYVEKPPEELFADVDLLSAIIDYSEPRHLGKIVDAISGDRRAAARFFDKADISHHATMLQFARDLTEKQAKVVHDLLTDKELNDTEHRFYHAPDKEVVFRYSHGDLECELACAMESLKPLDRDELDDVEVDDVLIPLYEILSIYPTDEATPVKAEIVAVSPTVKDELKNVLSTTVAESVANAVTSKGGRPKNSERAAGAYTQAQIAAMFGNPCTPEKVANWEAKARGAKRGSNPPIATVDGVIHSYSQKLRENPTAENMAILAAIIRDYKSRIAVKQRLKDAPTVVHAKCSETEARMRGIVQSESRKLHQNP